MYKFLDAPSFYFTYIFYRFLGGYQLEKFHWKHFALYIYYITYILITRVIYSINTIF